MGRPHRSGERCPEGVAVVLEVTGNCRSGGCGPQDRTCLWDVGKGAPRGGPAICPHPPILQAVGSRESRTSAPPPPTGTGARGPGAAIKAGQVYGTGTPPSS